MKSRNATRIGGVAGLVYVAMVVGAGFAVPPPPSADDSASKFLQYLSDNRTASMIQASITALAGIPLLPFAIAFGRRIRALEGEQPILANATTAGLLVGWAAAVPFMMMYGGLSWLANGSLTETEARNVMMLVNIGYGGMLALWAGTGIFSGLALVSTGDFTRVVGWFGFVAALLCVIAVFGWANSGLLSPGQAIFPAYLAFSLYMLMNSILMIRISDVPPERSRGQRL